MLLVSSPGHGKQSPQLFVCCATPAWPVSTLAPSFAPSAWPGQPARSKNKRTGAWRLGCTSVRPTFCTQLDWAAAGTKLGGQLQARCLVHPLLSLVLAHTTHFRKLSVTNFAQVSSIGQLLFNRPVDRSRSISTVDKDSPTWEYGRYRRSIRIHLLENTVDIWSTVDFTQKSVEIDRRYGFIPKKKRSISTVDVPSYQK